MTILRGKDNYKIENKIDEGTFGIVFKATNLKSLETVAIKYIKSQSNSEFLNEIKILQGLKHKNLIDLKEVFTYKNQIFIVYEYMKINLLKYYESFKKRVN